MVADLNNLIRVRKTQVKPAAGVLAESFYNYPLFTYFIPDATKRKEKLPHIFEQLVSYGVLYGEVYATTPNMEGVAVWLPSETADITYWRMIRNGALSLVFKLGMGVISRQMPVSNFITAVHKRHTPFRHWFLQLIGVAPSFQGKGYARTLLRAVFNRIDEEQLPCYLHTEDEKNVAIYQHYGFKVVEQIVIPGTEIKSWAMLRDKAG